MEDIMKSIPASFTADTLDPATIVGQTSRSRR